MTTETPPEDWVSLNSVLKERGREIRLVGGPCDGQRINWAGGDELRIQAGPPVIDFSLPTVDCIRPTLEAVYRQSIVTDTVFVWQP
jgi:hypothetical protein